MRQALPIIVATLLAAIAVDAVAAGVKSATRNGHTYSMAPAGITMAVPASMKNFAADALPQ